MRERATLRDQERLAWHLGEDPAAPGLTAACLGMQTAVGLDRAVEEGFAVVAQACRGTDISDGEFSVEISGYVFGVALPE